MSKNLVFILLLPLLLGCENPKKDEYSVGPGVIRHVVYAEINGSAQTRSFVYEETSNKEVRTIGVCNGTYAPMWEQMNFTKIELKYYSGGECSRITRVVQ